MFKNALLDFAASSSGLPAGRLLMDEKGVHSIGKGAVWSASFEELAQEAYRKNTVPHEKYLYVAPATSPMKECSDNFSNDLLAHRLHFSYCFGFQAAVVEVDENTGVVEVLRVYAASDVGRAVNPSLVEGQIEGGVAMGLGYALSEEFVMEKGYVKSTRLGDLGLPKTTQVPFDIRSFIVEDYHPHGPFGAKGMGELPMNATTPAILNAIHNAVGVWVKKLPARPEVIRALIRQDNRIIH
jgi:CO/xanthine dehydrogenase Mo-binding subunit